MKKTNINSKKGFTIIEVVLVLAIAGLIFLMVFIALPALQRSQRDTQRRNDYSMLSSAITSYAANNGGKLSKLYNTDGTCATLTASKFINSDGMDPDGQPYVLKACPAGKISAELKNDAPKQYYVYVIVGANCNGSNKNRDAYPQETNSTRAFAIYGYVESGTNAYCSASQ